MSTWTAPNGRVFEGRWCAEVMTNNDGLEIAAYELVSGKSFKMFDDEFAARGFAASCGGRFGFMRDRSDDKLLGPSHYFSLIHDYREPIE